MRKNGEVDGIMQFTAIVPMMLRMMVQTTGNHRLLLKKRVKLQTLKKSVVPFVAFVDPT